MRAVLSWHMRKFVAIWWPTMALQEGEVPIEFELRAKILNEAGPRMTRNILHNDMIHSDQSLKVTEPLAGGGGGLQPLSTSWCHNPIQLHDLTNEYHSNTRETSSKHMWMEQKFFCNLQTGTWIYSYFFMYNSFTTKIWHCWHQGQSNEVVTKIWGIFMLHL